MDEEYIKRDLTMQAIRNIRNTYSKATNFDAVSAVDNILGEIADEVPAADVAPVVHGHWVYGCQCSVCGDGHGPYNAHHKAYYNYCPNCGAKMDEECDR